MINEDTSLVIRLSVENCRELATEHTNLRRGDLIVSKSNRVEEWWACAV